MEAETRPAAPLVELLAHDEAVFGIFSGDKTREQGAAVASNREADFVFYSLEDGPFDIPTMESYVSGMEEAARAAGVDRQPLLLRVPPIHESGATAGDQVAQGLSAGAAGIVFPHVADASEAARSVELIGAAAPGEPNGTLLDVLIVEDRQGVAHAREIIGVEGLSVVFAGPGDLRRAFEGDMEQVEAAIQAVLAACLELDVPCGVTAGTEDIARRLQEGFRVIIVTEPEALGVGRAAAGRAAPS